MEIPEYIANNQAFDFRAISFNRQPKIAIGRHFPGKEETVQRGVVIHKDGSVEVTMMAIGAQTVEAGIEVGHDADWIELKDNGEGVWSGFFYGQEPGFKRLVFKVNGVLVLNPTAPIGYGDNRTINFVDIPNPEWDWLLMKDVPHGSINQEFYMSSVTGEFESCLVYTPPMYQEDLSARYPVLYLQHGGSDNETAWVYQAKVNFIMDNLIAEGKAVPCLIVMNNGMVQTKVDGEWKIGGDSLMQELVTKDCIPFIEKKYRVLTGKDNRAYAGLSMGSLQGARFICEYPEIFSYAGLFTGMLAPRKNGHSMPQPYLTALDNAEKFNSDMKLLFRAMGEQETSITLFAEESAMLDEKGIRYVARTYPGQHEWKVWRCAIHDYLTMIFREGMS